MNIKDYMNKKEISVAVMTELLDISAAHLRMLMSGSSAPSRKLALKIEKISNGEISKEDAIFNYKDKR